MRVEAVAPSADAHQFLPGSQFVDAFSVLTKNTQMTAKEAAERIFNQRPPWVGRLMSVRDMVVSPFGLKTSRMASNVADRVGIFPVISETPERLVCGLDDTHQDFRVIVDTVPASGSQRVTVTTVVLTHNLLGRSYLTVIRPFHKMIVRSMLKQVCG